VNRSWFNAPAIRVAVLAALFAGAGVHESAHQRSLDSIRNGDFWWHLRCGLGILETHAVPHSGLYSQASAVPWIASSWLYEVLSAIGYRVLGLFWVPLLAIVCKLALAILTFVLAGGLRGRFWTAVGLSVIAQVVLGGMQPLPVYGSALLFGIEMMLLLDYRRSGNLRGLYPLPLLFVVWANVDAQFVYGIAVLVFFTATEGGLKPAKEKREAVSGTHGGVPLPRLATTVLATLLATCITPYGWKPYGVFFSQLTSAANPYFPDYQSLRFRAPQDYLLLLLLMGAYLALGMRRSRDLFQIGTLVACTLAAFAMQRDGWLAVLAALAVIGYAGPETVPEGGTSRSQLWLAAGVAAILLIAAMAIHLPRGRKAMLAEIGEGYPVKAADYIRENRLPQPLFNAFPWGGFLTWYLPEYPVAIDGRTDLYGDDFNIQYAKAMNAEIHFSQFPPFSQAGTLLLERNSVMGKALASVPGFKVAYSDEVAVVLVREQAGP